MKKTCTKKTALLVIDMQRYFLDKGAPAFVKSSQGIVPNVLRLVESFRGAGLPVIFTCHAHKRGRPTGQMGKWWRNRLPWEGTRNSEIISKLKPKRGEAVITKQRYSAFEGTRLEKILKRLKVRAIVICGVMTNLCVETTARHAFMKDFAVTIVEDACAANTPRHHRASILNLSYGFAEIVRTQKV